MIASAVRGCAISGTLECPLLPSSVRAELPERCAPVGSDQCLESPCLPSAQWNYVEVYIVKQQAISFEESTRS